MSIGTMIFEFEFFAGLFLAFAICYFIGWLLNLDDKYKDDINI
jgi:hypothetical protein